MGKKHKIFCDLELDEVMTSGEVVAVFGLSDSTVRNACKRGSIPARKSGGVWLVKRSDAVARWGSVKSPDGMIIDLMVSGSSAFVSRGRK